MTTHIVFVVDISGSMDQLFLYTEEYKITRLQMVKHFLACFANEFKTMEDTRVSVISYSDDPKTIVDDVCAKDLIKFIPLIYELEVYHLTYIGKAILHAYSTTKTYDKRTIILMTDGEDTESMGYYKGKSEYDAIIKYHNISDNLKLNTTLITLGVSKAAEAQLMYSLGKIGNGGFLYIPDRTTFGLILGTLCGYLKYPHKITYYSSDLEKAKDILCDIADMRRYDCKFPAMVSSLNLGEDMDQLVMAVKDSDTFDDWGVGYISMYASALYNSKQCSSLCKSLSVFVDDYYKFGFDEIITNIANTNMDSKLITAISEKVEDFKLAKQTIGFASSIDCFSGDSLVYLVSHNGISVNSLVKAESINNNSILMGSNDEEVKVKYVVKNHVINELMVNIGNNKYTPYHPVEVNGTWVYPKSLQYPTTYYTGYIYSFVLETKRVAGILSDLHKIAVIGHEIYEDEILRHPYYGTDECVNTLLKVIKPNNDGIIDNEGHCWGSLYENGYLVRRKYEGKIIY